MMGYIGCFILGGMVGVFVMCLVTASNNNDYVSKDKEVVKDASRTNSGNR